MSRVLKSVAAVAAVVEQVKRINPFTLAPSDITDSVQSLWITCAFFAKNEMTHYRNKDKSLGYLSSREEFIEVIGLSLCSFILWKVAKEEEWINPFSAKVQKDCNFRVWTDKVFCKKVNSLDHLICVDHGFVYKFNFKTGLCVVMEEDEIAALPPISGYNEEKKDKKSAVPAPAPAPVKKKSNRTAKVNIPAEITEEEKVN